MPWGFLTAATWRNVVWCMYGSLVSFIPDMWGLKRVRKCEYLHLCTCISETYQFRLQMPRVHSCSPAHAKASTRVHMLAFMCLYVKRCLGRELGKRVTAVPACDVLLTELHNRHNDDLWELWHAQQLQKSNELHISGSQQQFVFPPTDL